MSLSGWGCRSHLNSFGPIDDEAFRASWIERVLESTFLLVNRVGFTEEDVNRMPVWKRTWYLERAKKEYEKPSDPSKNAIDGRILKELMSGIPSRHQG